MKDYKKILEERDISDKKYAIKLVEQVVFSILGVVGIAVLVKLLLLIQL